MEHKASSEAPTAVAPADSHPPATPRIPDYELLHPIDRGAYGEVWLARNIMGTWRAVKIVHRKNFSDDAPFEREFSGIRHFEKVAGAHPGLVNILHIGRNDSDGYFYYVMELADDSGSASPAAPQGTAAGANARAYSARTLASDLAKRGRLPVPECVDIGLALCSALHHLHSQGLIHRDIKPANIIFVKGAPKLADIGLVTEIRSDVTMVGSESYLPREGPGKPTADIYSLGRVLYVLSTGRRANQFPELPADLDTKAAESEFLSGCIEFNKSLLKACDENPATRYQSAQEMQEDLTLLQKGQPVASATAGRRPRKWRRIAATAVAVGIGAVLAVQFLVRPYLIPGKPTLPARVVDSPAGAVLQMVYADANATPVAGAARATLQFQLLAKRKGDAGFRPLRDGDALASEVDDYLFVTRSSAPGYLYVFQVDSTGKTDWLFPKNPSSTASSGSNPVNPGEALQVPSTDKQCFYLDKTAGVEHVYAIFSQTRWPELEGALSKARPSDPTVQLASATRHVEQPFGLGTRGVAGTRPALVAFNAGQNLDRIQQGQSYKLTLGDQVFEASASRSVIEHWFRHVPP